MAYRVLVMPSAHLDLEESFSFIEADSPERARRWLSGVWECIFSLADMPGRFAIIDEAEELGGVIRDVVYHSHRDVYRVVETESRLRSYGFGMARGPVSRTRTYPDLALPFRSS